MAVALCVCVCACICVCYVCVCRHKHNLALKSNGLAMLTIEQFEALKREEDGDGGSCERGGSTTGKGGGKKGKKGNKDVDLWD